MRSLNRKNPSPTRFFFRKLSSWLRRGGVSGVGSDQVGSVKPVTRLGLGLRLRLSPIWKNPISHSAPFEKLLSTMYFLCILLLRSEIIIFILRRHRNSGNFYSVISCVVNDAFSLHPPTAF